MSDTPLTIPQCNSAHTANRCLLSSTNIKIKYLLTLTWRLSPRRTGFHSRPLHVIFVVKTEALGQAFLPVLLFPCQHHPTRTPHSSSSTCCSYEMGKRQKRENLPRSNVLHETGERWIENCFYMKIKEKLQAQKMNVRKTDRNT